MLDNKICQSCAMPMPSDGSLYGAELDGIKNDSYCIYCYKEGKFSADISMDEMIAYCVDHMMKIHLEIDTQEAKAMMEKSFPLLKRWQNTGIHKLHLAKTYFMAIDGKGNPSNSISYTESMEFLYQIFFALQDLYKGKKIFCCSPPHTIWWDGDDSAPEEWSWRNMVEIPEYITESDIRVAKEVANRNLGILNFEVFLWELNEATAFQVIHNGAYEQEGLSGEKLRHFIQEAGYRIKGYQHDIYLNNPRNTPQDQLQTMIRYAAVHEMEESLSFEEEKKNVFEQLGETQIMNFATSADSHVSTRNMSVIIHDGKFYIQTSVDFRKSRDIEQNKQVALCFKFIQIEGEITNTYQWHDDAMENFRILHQKHHASSNKAYSRLMENRIFEITPTCIQIYAYEKNDIFIKKLDFSNNIAGQYCYLRNF